jgi:hypothetical protein
MKIMKDNNKANNLLLGAIYINANSGQPMRLISILPCQGVWMETFDGQGYGDLIKFEDVSHADIDEVQDFLEDLRVYTASEKAPAYKPEREYYGDKEIVRDSDGSAVIGWYDDNDGNDYRCRD